MLIQAPDGRLAELKIWRRQQLSPREVADLARRAAGPTLVIAPFLSPRTRELLASVGISYVDQTGNLRIVTEDPAVFMEAQGADRDPSRQPRMLRSLKGPAAGRVVRALCDLAPPYGVRQLAGLSSTPLSTVSRVVSFLEEEALLERDSSKRIAHVDWSALLHRWAQDYSVRSSNHLRSFIEPRGLAALWPRLTRLKRHAVTGSAVGTGVAPVRLAAIYVDDVVEAGELLSLVPTDSGANVWLLGPGDEVVFERTLPFSLGEHEVTAVAHSQRVVDLLTGPGRGPQEALSLLEWMKGAEDEWRHRGA